MSDTNPKPMRLPWDVQRVTTIRVHGRQVERWRIVAFTGDAEPMPSSVVAEMVAGGQLEAEFIVEAVNSHAALKARCAELEAALTEAEEYMSSNVPGNGWGLLDKSADADRERVLSVIRALLSPRDGEAK